MANDRRDFGKTFALQLGPDYIDRTNLEWMRKQARQQQQPLGAVVPFPGRWSEIHFSWPVTTKGRQQGCLRAQTIFEVVASKKVSAAGVAAGGWCHFLAKKEVVSTARVCFVAKSFACGLFDVADFVLQTSLGLEVAEEIHLHLRQPRGGAGFSRWHDRENSKSNERSDLPRLHCIKQQRCGERVAEHLEKPQ